MVYLCVLIALLLLTIKGYSGKKTSIYVRNEGDSFLFNLIRMIFCIAVGIIIIIAENSQNFLAIDKTMLIICFFAGLANSAFLVGWLLAIQKNSMVLVDVTLTVGSLIPAVLCAILFMEPISLPKMIGYGLIISASYILSGYSKAVVGNQGISGIIFLAVAAIGDGLTGFCQQLYKHYCIKYPNSVYQFYTYLFASIILFIVWFGYILTKRKTAVVKEEKMKGKGKLVLHIAIMAVCLFAASYLQTAATSDYGMPSQVLYPVIKGGCLITVNITAMLFFGEKPNKRSILGSCIALLGIIALNVL